MSARHLKGQDTVGAGGPARGAASASGGRVSTVVHRHRWPLLAGLGLALVIGGGLLAVALSEGPSVTLASSHRGLARVTVAGAGAKLTKLDAVVDGRVVPLRDEHGRLVPTVALPEGTAVAVDASVRAPSWLSWLTGSEASASTTVTTPEVAPVTTVVDVTPGTATEIRFSAPVERVTYRADGVRHVLRLTRGTRTVALGADVASGAVGSLSVAASVEPWELPSSPVSVTYFGGSTTMLLATPPPGSTSLTPTTPIRLTFSRPLSVVLGSKLPVISPSTPGHWRTLSRYTIEFVPDGVGAWPGSTLSVTLPKAVGFADQASAASLTAATTAATTTTTIDYQMAPGSTLRIQQILSQLGYLPLSWTPAPGVSEPTTELAEESLALHPPKGSFAFKWSMPARFEQLWSAGSDTVMTEGAIMAFEQVNGLNTVGLSNPLLWSYLAHAALTHATDPHGYTWIEVTQNLPEHLNLWYNGKIILTTLANTGIPQSPTENGTFPVYARYAFNYMSGYNPNGTYYHDPVHWIAYFNGGDAVHGFYRPDGYGFPQSLGCVELPVEGNDPIAEQVWGYDHIGTLVTVYGG